MTRANPQRPAVAVPVIAAQTLTTAIHGIGHLVISVRIDPYHHERAEADGRKRGAHPTWGISALLCRYTPPATHSDRKPIRNPMTGTMRSFFQLAPRPLLQLVTAILLAPRPASASPALPLTALARISFNDLFARQECGGEWCGYNNWLCCNAGSTCYTDAASQAQCGAATAAATATNGYWEYYTTTYVETDLATVTSVMSSYIDGGAGASPTSTATSECNENTEGWCGGICCASNQYCGQPVNGAWSCLPAGGGSSSAYYVYTTTTSATSGATAGAPIRPTSSSGVVVTSTQSPTVTVPFSMPVATGANVTLTSEERDGGGGLSGGAIAGIVIGVLLALALLALLCFCCCVKGLLDGLLAIFGIGGRRRQRVTEVEEYERRSHHASGGGRKWYGAAAPSRTSRYEERKEKSHTGRNLLGIGAGLAALWAVLGLKRRRQERKNEEKYSEYSYSSDYYTSASE
nr:hypothetical protein CFP56_00831 [Quercus suber]